MSKKLRVAALIDLPRSPLSGGHVKGWERRARAVARSDLPLDLTVYFSGPEAREELAPHVRFRQLPPVFSTARLKFLPYVPDHTDLAPYHPALARELSSFDVLHTTDGFFAFARTAEKVSKEKNIPLVTSFHTDTPSYARVFTRKTIETLCGQNVFSRFLTDTLRLPEKQEEKMTAKIRRHLTACSAALAVRPEDREMASEILGADRVFEMHTGTDLKMFAPSRRDRDGVESAYGIPSGRFLIVFVGRLDIGKNIYVLIDAMEKLVAAGVNVHLFAAGIGPAEKDLRRRLGARATVAGFVQPEEMGRVYASADAYVMPSEVEIRSQAAMEAIACGLPSLVSAKSGIAALFENTQAMRPVGGGADDWTKALRELIADAESRASMARAALTYREQRLQSWLDVMEKDFLAVWQKAYEEGSCRSSPRAF